MSHPAGLKVLSPSELQAGIANLSRGAYFKEAPLDVALSLITEAAANMSGVERVSIWGLTSDHRELRCLDLFTLSSGQHSNGEVILSADHPAYFAALRRGENVVADRAGVDPITAEFARAYLPASRVTALLDTPIHIRGELQGVLCLEQVGVAQAWAPVHQLFGQALANLVTLALVEFEAAEAKRAAREANERLQALRGLQAA